MNYVTIITVPFTYDMPDDYLAQTNTLGNKGTYTYVGPDTLYIFVDQVTGKWDRRAPLHDGHDGSEVPVPLHQIRVDIDCAKDPLLAVLFGGMPAEHHPDPSEQPTIQETLPDGTIYERQEQPDPHHTYEVMDMVYDPIAKAFTQPYPWKQPHMTWAGIRQWRNSLLYHSDHVAQADDTPDSVKTQWETYRQKLKDLPNVHGAVNVKTKIDATVLAPINTEGQLVIQVEDISGVEVGMDVSTSLHDVVQVFQNFITNVVDVDVAKKQVTLNIPVKVTPGISNLDVTFHSEPDTKPWKIRGIQNPDGEGDH